MTKSAIATLMTKSLETAEPFFVLSALPPSELDVLAAQRAATWQRSGKPNKMKNDLAMLTLSFPWSETPAHSLFAQIIEQWKPEDLRNLVQSNLGYWGDDAHKVTDNAHLGAVLKGLVSPGHNGDGNIWERRSVADADKTLRSLHRAYLLDPTSQVSDRRKLGYARPLTTQDRYELLACLFRCRQGLDENIQHTRVWLTLDRAERILDCPPTEQKLLIHGCTTLLTRLPEYFTLWINITDPDPDILAKVKKACGTLLPWLDHEFSVTIVEGDS